MVAFEDATTWPLDVLPLVKPDGNLFPELGVLLPGQPTVYMANAFEPGLCQRLTKCKKIMYPSFAAVRDAGWVVD